MLGANGVSVVNGNDFDILLMPTKDPQHLFFCRLTVGRIGDDKNTILESLDQFVEWEENGVG